MTKPIRWGIMGYARIARTQLIPALLRAENAVPYAIASRNAEKLEEAVGEFGFAKAYEGYGALLEDPDVDAIYIPLPNSLHKEWTLKAARAGKHVLCEKPMALSAEDCREMAEICRECGVKLAEAFMYRLSSRVRKINELLDSGAIGEVRNIQSCFRLILNNPENVKLQPELGGGCLWDIGCYPINLIGMIMKQEPVSYSAQKVMQYGVDIGFSAVLKYPGGVLCTVNSGFDSQSNFTTEINGTQGALLIRETFQGTDAPMLLVQNGQTTEIPVESCERYILEVEDFSDAILSNREPFLSMEETIRNNGLMKKLLDCAE